eukprot:scaffold13115_cov139-Skeletonema_dohrnii-CCMP3373.AAC.2
MATVSNNLRRSSRKRGNSEISQQSEPSLKTEEDSAGSSSEQIAVATEVEKQSVAVAPMQSTKSEIPPIKCEEGEASSTSEDVKPPAKTPLSAGAAAMAAVAKDTKVAPQSQSSSVGTESKTNASTTTAIQPPPKSSSPPPPLKALTFHHLQKKYGSELDYMLIEFRKLERQLLGAPAASAKTQQQKPEAAGSKERREKLHGFILHLEDTIRQVSEGCQLEKKRKSSSSINEGEGEKKPSDASLQKQATLPTAEFTAADASLSHLPPEKEKEESVQRLEEHILANLLPVKVRLTRQLAAQKGATRNPATAPVKPGAPATGAGSSFADAEAKRKAKERLYQQQQPPQKPSPSQFGKPIAQAGSSLTARLHGKTLGAGASAAKGPSPIPETAAAAAPHNKRRILYAGIAPGSSQVSSSVNAVAGVHPGLIDDSAAKASSLAEEERKRMKRLEESAARVALGTGVVQPATATALNLSKHVPIPSTMLKSPPEGPATLAARAQAVASIPQPQPVAQMKAPPPPVAKPKKPHIPPNYDDPSLSAEQVSDLRIKEARWRQHKRRRERRRQRLEGRGNYPSSIQQPHRMHPSSAGQSSVPSPSVNTSSIPGAVVNGVNILPKQSGFHGPRTVEYVCSMCNEGYPSNSDVNPWWVLTSHECPKCGKVQIPRLDISAPANAIEYHPALLAHMDDGNSKMSAVDTSDHHHAPASGLLPYQHGSYLPRPAPPILRSFSDSDVSHTDVSDGEGGNGKYDESSDEEEEIDLDDADSVTREEKIEKEEFGFEYKGEQLSDDQARRLLVLIEHASTCPGRHQCPKHRNVCHSTKYLMLHVRDCTGLLSNGDVCPFPWCRKVKHLLYHLVSCEKGKECSICCPEKLPSNLVALTGLNQHRREKFRERTKALAAVAAAKRQQMAAIAPTNSSHIARQPASVTAPKKSIPSAASQLARSQPVPNNVASSAICSAAKVPGQSNPGISRVPVAQSTLKEIVPNITTAPIQQPSPALSACLPGTLSSLSVSALPTLEEAAMDIDDINLSVSEPLGS